MANYFCISVPQQYKHDVPARKGRKRSRTPEPAIVLVAAVAVFTAICRPALGFSFQAHSLRPLLHLYASAKIEVENRPRTMKRQPEKQVYDGYSNNGVSENAVSRVKPRKAISEKKRARALETMKDRTKIDSALKGVDAQMLELLSEHFLYPENLDILFSENLEKSVAAARTRPKGRPESVPGAMKYDTILKYRERQEFMSIVEKEKELSTTTPYSEQNGDLPDRELPKSARKGVKGTKSDSSSENEVSKNRKRLVKSLPKPRTEAERESAAKRAPRKIAKGDNLELHKYYRTQLLSADEEYSLGMKIQFMTKCEQVHEGLSIDLLRLPTIQEWAEACGFKERDPEYVPLYGDEQIRPAGSESMFDETDPNMFVGNGLAHSAGPGRGRGRVKKPPPLELTYFYDDSLLKAGNHAKDSDEKPSKDLLKPVNRGTVEDFIEMMMAGKEAKQRMVQSNMRLVVSIARKYANVGVTLQDLVQEGSLGLSRAAEKFEPTKGFKFSTYASWWIQQAVFRSIAYHSRTIRLPVHVHNLLNRMRKVKNSLERDLGRSPSNEEMAEKLDTTLVKYNKMLQLTKRALSLDVPKYRSNPKDFGHESDEFLADNINSDNVDQDDSTPERSVDRGLFHDDLKEMLKILDDDERRVLCARYGLADGLTRTVTAVAAEMKESTAWVRSQECRALRKLRRPWYEKKLKEHQDALSN